MSLCALTALNDHFLDPCQGGLWRRTGTSTSGNTERIQAKSGRLVKSVSSNMEFLLMRIAQCTTKDNYLVAHYDLRPSHIRYFDASGNSLVIYEAFAHLAPGTNYFMLQL